jgi:hypothetical protein
VQHADPVPLIVLKLALVPIPCSRHYDTRSEIGREEEEEEEEYLTDL